MSRITGSDAKSLMEAYSSVYAPQELTEEQVWEEVENWVNSLLEEGYDLSEYTWEEMYEAYFEEQGGQRGSGSSASQTNQSVSGKQVSNAINTGVQRTIGSTPVVAGARYVAQQAQSASAVPSSGGPRNVRGGGQLRSTTVPSRPQPTFQNTGGYGRYGSPETQVKTPAAAKPTAPATKTPVPATKTPVPATKTPVPAPAAPKVAPKPAAPAPGTKSAGPESIKPKTPNPLLKDGEIGRMKAASLMRQQGRNLPSGKVPTSSDLAPKPAPAAKVTPAAAPGVGQRASGLSLGSSQFKASAPTPPVKAVTPTAAVSAAPSSSAAASGSVAPATAKIAAATGPKTRAQVLGQSFEYDAFDLVLEYLTSEGHVETVEEALYVMMEMDPETIHGICEMYELGELHKERHGQSEKANLKKK